MPPSHKLKHLPPAADAYSLALDAWLNAGPDRNDTIALDLLHACGDHIRSLVTDRRDPQRDPAPVIAVLLDLLRP